METLSGKKALALLELHAADLQSGSYRDKVNHFMREVKEKQQDMPGV